MSDEETLRVYAARAGDYAQLVARTKPDLDLMAFLDMVPPGGRILDLGCGPGNSAAMMQARGYVVEASDASPEMVALARDEFGIKARCESFAALEAVARFDGIWANFSLLHAEKAEFPGHLQRIKTALKPGGHFHIGMKLGNGEDRDSLGRFYAYYSEDELIQHLEALNLAPIRIRRGQEAGLSGEVAPFVVILTRRAEDG